MHGRRELAAYRDQVKAKARDSTEAPSARTAAIEPPQYSSLMGLSWLHLLNDGAANYLPGILPAVLLALGQDIKIAGVVMFALLIGQAFQVVAGWFADYFGGRLFIALGVLGSSLAGAVIGLAPNMWVLIPALLVIGLSSALFHPPALVVVRRLSGSRIGFSMSVFLIGGELGRGVWPFAASAIVVAFGLRNLWILAIPAIISVAILWRGLPRSTPHRAKAGGIDWRRSRGPMTLLIAFAVMRALCVYGAVTYLPVLWHLRGHGLVAGAASISVMLVVGIIGNAGGGHLADRFGRIPVLLGSSLAGALLIVAFLLISGPAQWVILGLLGIAMFAARPITVLIGQDIFPQNRSFGSGIALGLSNALAAAALPVLDLVSSAQGPEAVLWFLAGTMLLAGVLSLKLPRDEAR